MTQMELADLMGVSYQAVSNWERGNSMPDISKLGDLAAVLDVLIDEIIGNVSSINLAKHVLAGDEKNYFKDEKVDVHNISELTNIAPFISGEVLAEIARNEFEKGTLKDLAHLAPFLPNQALHDIAEKFVRENGIASIGPITPFL